MNGKEHLDMIIDAQNGKVYNAKGKQLGHPNKNTGYIEFTFQNKRYLAHRLIYECHHNVKLLPKQQINHINRKRDDNRIENLEIVTNQQNAQWTHNRTGQYKGVQWNEDHNKWRAELKYDNKSYNLGYFDHEIDAAKAYNDFAEYLNQTQNCRYLLNTISESDYKPTPRNVPEDNKQSFMNNKSCSSYVGVQYHKLRNHFFSQIKHNGKTYFLGSSKDPAECAKFYNQQAAFFNSQNPTVKYKLNEDIPCEQKNIIEERKQKHADNKTSQYYGVSFSKQKNKWIAVIAVDKKQRHIGSYDNEKDAAKAYNETAVLLNKQLKEGESKRLYKINDICE